MGTHPIFESDFDCLTEQNSQRVGIKKRELYGKMTVTKTPLIVVTDPDQHIIMKVLNDYLDPAGRKWSDEQSRFFPAVGKIHILVKEARQLMDRDLIAKSDPYCVIKCGPTKVQTTMKKNNLNPAWKESFDFDWHGEEIVKIECWDHNKFTKHDFLGEAQVSLYEILTNKKCDQSPTRKKQIQWIPLQGNRIKHGEILIDIEIETLREKT